MLAVLIWLLSSFVIALLCLPLLLLSGGWHLYLPVVGLWSLLLAFVLTLRRRPRR